MGKSAGMRRLKCTIHHLLEVIKKFLDVATMSLRSSIWKHPKSWQWTSLCRRTDPAA